MSFQIKQTKLSSSCQHNINKLLQGKRIKCNMPVLLYAIENWLTVFVANYQKKPEQRHVPAKHIREDVRALLKTLNGINAATKELLRTEYLKAYPMPPPDHPDYPMGKPYKRGNNILIMQRILNQTHETHFFRCDKQGVELGLPVPLDELIERLLKTCELAEAHFRPSVGAPRDWLKVRFIAQMLNIFERLTGKKATATPNAVFDKFIGYILVDVANEPHDAPNYRKLIETANSCCYRTPPFSKTHRSPMSVLDNTEMLLAIAEKISE